MDSNDNIELVQLFDRVNQVSTVREVFTKALYTPYLFIYFLVVLLSVLLFIFTILVDVGESLSDVVLYAPFYALSLFKIIDAGFMYKIIDIIEGVSAQQSFRVLVAVSIECTIVVLVPLALLFQQNGHLQGNYEKFVNAATFVVLLHDQYFIFSVALLFYRIRARHTRYRKKVTTMSDDIIISDVEIPEFSVKEVSALNKFKNKIKPYVYTRFKLFSICFAASSAVVVYLGHQSNLNNFGIINFALCSMMFLSTSLLINVVNVTIAKFEKVYDIDLQDMKLKVLVKETDHVLAYSVACTLIVTVFHLLFAADL